jgi:hypothetical protein
VDWCVCKRSLMWCVCSGQLNGRAYRIAEMDIVSNLYCYVKSSDFQTVFFVDNAEGECREPDHGPGDYEMSTKTITHVFALMTAHNAMSTNPFLVCLHTRAERVGNILYALGNQGPGMTCSSIIYYIAKRPERGEHFKPVVHVFMLITRGRYGDLPWMEYTDARNTGNVILRRQKGCPSPFHTLVQTVLSHHVVDNTPTNICSISTGMSQLPQAVLENCVTNKVNCTLVTTSRAEAETLVTVYLKAAMPSKSASAKAHQGEGDKEDSDCDLEALDSDDEQEKEHEQDEEAEQLEEEEAEEPEAGAGAGDAADDDEDEDNESW